MARAGSYDVKIPVVLPKEIMSYFESLAEREGRVADMSIRSILWEYAVSHPIS